ncbi:MAG: DUF3604 domain-containing protein [Pseudomonadota bacterium]
MADEAVRREAFFGDLHVHTRYSYDAFVFNVRAGPDDAYRYARGESLEHPNGYAMRLRGPPLDFMAVTDHATYLGVLPSLEHPESRLAGSELADLLVSEDFSEAMRGHRQVTRSIITGETHPEVYDETVIRSSWQEIVEAAERHYEPGEFTTFVGYEFTSHPGANLHRNVIFRSSKVPEMPFAALDSLNPEKLWRWMDEQRRRGIDSLAIPHNANWSNGMMFQRSTFRGDALDSEYSERRLRNEPLVEITQVKGTSETHPLLSPNDEWAGFELFGDDPERLIGGNDGDPVPLQGSYVRDALRGGIALEARSGHNPFRFGVVGSSDSHNAAAAYYEADYAGKTGVSDGTPERRGSVLPEGVTDWDAMLELEPDEAPTPYLINWSSAGLAGIWAEENTRESLFRAMRRKETFATSGPRIRLRFFAGYGYDADVLEAGATQRLYRGGVPMGGDLPIQDDDAAPRFVVQALGDPLSAGLDRLQIIKGWVEDGETRERVYDVACAGGEAPDSRTHRCGEVSRKVPGECGASRDAGAAGLGRVWRDPGFDPNQRAFYYARVLERPSCRWSTWDARRAGDPPNPKVPAMVQQRAWSSPIWIVP